MNITNIIVKIIDKFENDRNLIEEFTAVGAPKLIYNGADDKYQSIMASEFQFNLMVNDKTDGKFFHLYTGNEKRYLVTVEDQDNNLLFEGYLLPDFYSEPYDNGVIFVDLTATDGLGLLKGQYLPNQYYKQETSVIKLIAECLRFTQLDKNIVFAPAIESAATDYRWDEIAVNGATYLDGEIEFIFMVGEKMPKRKNAYEILDLLLECLGCTLYGQGDTWFIEGINRKHEENQFVYNYDKDGVFVNTNTVVKNVIDLTFFKTPTVSIVSPWKRVDVEWNIDEDGDLVPSWALKENPVTGFIESPVKNVYDFWKPNGLLNINVFSNQLKYIMQFYGTTSITPGSFPFSIIWGNQSPRNLQVSASYNVGTSINQSQNPARLESDYIDIKNKKYLKVSDEYIERKISIDYKFASKARLIENNPNNPAFEDELEKDLANAYKNEFTVGNSILISSKLNDSNELCKKPFAKKNAQNINYPDDLSYLDYFDWQPYNCSVELKVEDIELPINGFFNTKLHAPLSIDYTEPWFYDYVVQTLSVKISELKTWNDSLIRAIDFTTKKEISIFHGDSIADLTEKQFRFRRPIYGSVGGYGAVSILSYENLFPLQPWFYHYFISLPSYMAIIANPELFYVTYGGNNILMNDLNSGINEAWSVNSTWAGLYFIQINSQLIDHPSGIGSNITDFLNLFVGESDVYIVGYEPENNEWRESWKRYGQTEDIRYGVALAKIYHDVQPKALVKLEGSAIGCLFPREIGKFLWRDVKQFIPARITIDFTKGRSEVLLLESLHEIVTDYVN